MARDRIARSFARLPLGSQGMLVVAIPVCALLAAMAVFYQFQRQSRRAVGWVEHTYQVHAEIRRMLLRAVNMESSARGYLLTHQAAFLEPYWLARKELPETLDSLNHLVSDNPAQVEQIAQVRAVVSQTLDSMEALRQDAAANRAADAFNELGRSGAQMNELRRILANMGVEEERLLVERAGQEQKAQQRLEVAIFAGGLLGLLGALVAAILFTTRIVRRVQHLEEDARRVAQGLPIVGEVTGRDEIARLERTLKETSQLLGAQREQLRAAHSELEARVERRTAELSAANEELRRATELNQAVIQSSPLAIWAIDLEGEVSFWNPTAERIFGFAQDEVIGRPLPIIPPDLREEYGDWLERFRKGEALSAVERARIKKDGSRIEVVIWTAPLRDAAGSIRGTIAIDSDLTERKVLEEQFRQSQKLEAVGRLAGCVAHDFNNLLTVIVGYTEMLIGEARDRPNLLDYAVEVQGAAERAAALTAQLLAFSRRQISQPRLLDLNEVVTHSMKLLRRVIGEDIEIATHLEAGLGRVKADPNHLDQVIMNLVVNARDAMGEGGKLTIETANQVLDTGYVGRHIGVTPGPYCLLAISDTGMGMDAQTRSRLFEPFFTTKEAGKGTGLGLAIVYGIVKQNGGEIMVYSEAGKGTTFKIYLPMVEAAEEQPKAAGAHVAIRGSETILLCEDEGSIRKLVRTMLEKQGYRVLEAGGPDEAVRISQETAAPIHLLLTDIIMPHTSGFDLAKRLREIAPAMKVLYMSGYTDNQVSRVWSQQPDAPFIQKPFTAEGLAQKLREALCSSATA